VLLLLMEGLHQWFGFGRRVRWDGMAFVFIAVWVLIFCSSFGMNFLQLRRIARVDSALVEAARSPQLLNTPCFGFVAMEYYALILNRTFVIFLAPGVLYGWKAQGPVSAATPKFFAPYREMLKDEAFTSELAAIKRLAALPGGFVLPRPRIASVEFTPSRKWGMGRVRHTGRIFVTSDSGVRREFILLGEVDGPAIRQRILTMG